VSKDEVAFKQWTINYSIPPELVDVLKKKWI